MLLLKNIRSVLEEDPGAYDSNHFLKIHIHVEAYIKRLMLIGLRLKGVQYDDSVTIVQSVFIPIAKLIDKTLFLIDPSTASEHSIIAGLKNKHTNFFALKGLVTDFTSIYRNRLAHGTIENLPDQDLIDCLCHTNKSFFRSFEHLLKTEFGHSAFDKPGDWGAKAGHAASIQTTISKFKLGREAKKPMSLHDVRTCLKATGYALP